jgi:polyhydroxybutyrate depolymerase
MPGLVVDLHSARTNGFLEELATRFNQQQADRLGWLVAYSDGIADGWDAYGCCSHPGVDDVKFVAALIERLKATDSVDPARVYVTGLSRGGMMACEMSSELAAIAPVAGNMADETGGVHSVPCQPERGVSVLAIHGANDTVVPVEGRGRFAPLDDVIGRWRNLNGCEPTGSETLNGAWPTAAGAAARARK